MGSCKPGGGLGGGQGGDVSPDAHWVLSIRSFVGLDVRRIEKTFGFEDLDVRWTVKTRGIVGLDVRGTVKTRRFVDPYAWGGAEVKSRKLEQRVQISI